VSDPRGERVEVRDAARAARRDAPDRDAPLLDMGTKILLVVFAIAVIAAFGAIAVAVIAY